MVTGVQVFSACGFATPRSRVFLVSWSMVQKLLLICVIAKPSIMSENKQSHRHHRLQGPYKGDDWREEGAERKFGMLERIRQHWGGY